MNKIIALGIFLLSAIGVFSQQKSTVYQQLYWMRYFNQLELNTKWNLQNELDERLFFKNSKQQQFITHSRIHYKIKKDCDLATGFTWSLQSTQDPNSASKLIIPEYRLDQESTINSKINSPTSCSI
mgnify:CR=1 FL=1